MGPAKRATLLSTLALVLAAPASALAGVTTVDPAATGNCSRDGTCRTIGAAVGVAQPTDTIRVLKGNYAEDVVVPADKSQLTFTGTAGAVVAGAGAGAAFTVNAPTTTIERLAIAKSTGAEPALVAAGGKLTLRDAIVFSFSGPAMAVTTGLENRIQRSTIASLDPAGAASDGVALAAASAGDRALRIESSIVVGGTRAAAYRVTTAPGSGAATLTLNHVTTTGGSKGIVLDATGGGGILLQTPGSITANISASIVHGASTAANYVNPNPLPLPPDDNTVTASFKNSDATTMTAAPGTTPSINMGGATNTPDSQLFGRLLRLKFGAPVIDKGGAAEAGESATDIDGDPRTAGAATDIGADEFVNHKPTLSLTAVPAAAKTGEAVTVTAKADDPEGAGDIAGFAFDFGDGKRQNSTSPSLQHVYEKPGTYKVSAIAADRGGLLSEVATQTVTVTDGTPPDVAITSPRAGARVTLTRTRKKGAKRAPKPRRLTVKGTDADAAGVARVEVALTRVSGGCAQYTGKRFAKAPCTKLTFIRARLSGATFKLTTRKGLRFKKGTYELRARGTDIHGNATSAFSRESRTLIRFRVA